MMMVMMMMMMVMMLMMMMKMVKTVMAVMAMMHKRWMDSLVAGKKIQYFARSYTGFYNDNIFPNGTTHETCEIKDCP